MIKITDANVAHAGGFLSALSDKSVEYMQSVLGQSFKPLSQQAVDQLERIIIHTDPHLDEYFAQLLFRACLPREKWQCDLVEQSIFSETDDLGAKHLWPSAAVLGVGSTFGGGARPLFLFDEHVSGQSKVAASCSQIVADKMLSSVPSSVRSVLDEVNTIDEFGGGHPQNLNNLVKSMHEIRFLFDSSASDGAQVRDNLTPQWKRAIVDACLVAVVFCQENRINLLDNPDLKREALISSLENYIVHSPHTDEPRFDDAVNRMRSIFGDQQRTFKQAILGTPAGKSTPQLLLISRICFACTHCWGEAIRDVIATHFWEGELQNQLHFYAVEDAVGAAVRGQKIKVSTQVGTITHNVLREIDVMAPDHRGGPLRRKRAHVWVVTITPVAGVSRIHQAIQNYLNENNHGCGFILLKSPASGTAALFKGSHIPEEMWRRLVNTITSREGDCWHVIERSDGTIAPFILNGNKTHQYVPRTGLDDKALVELVKRTVF
ncbi:hypothetical protein TSA1_29700 [Bradyrhizobium nitroreducens]|uniref:Uncharacterized protein n=1 Tax=Bradyrhizobium nitroreducens TaxID=709803 RepID=A0A2M6UIR5_9BRAD|nr:hypothetical protein [Bradyrhizobium nitroreducens]PIT04468.1 hypothetical protein TSA1_29700 [Bradyrhizobium nitroreducens]